MQSWFGYACWTAWNPGDIYVRGPTEILFLVVISSHAARLQIGGFWPMLFELSYSASPLTNSDASPSLRLPIRYLIGLVSSKTPHFSQRIFFASFPTRLWTHIQKGTKAGAKETRQHHFTTFTPAASFCHVTPPMFPVSHKSLTPALKSENIQREVAPV
jgi:hypothetical protein